MTCKLFPNDRLFNIFTISNIQGVPGIYSVLIVLQWPEGCYGGTALRHVCIVHIILYKVGIILAFHEFWNLFMSIFHWTKDFGDVAEKHIFFINHDEITSWTNLITHRNEILQFSVLVFFHFLNGITVVCEVNCDWGRYLDFSFLLDHLTKSLLILWIELERNTTWMIWRSEFL